MSKTHKRLTVPINDLALDTDNPRIISQEDEKSCIETMLNMNEVYILNLAEDIAKNGLKNKDIIVKKGTGAMKCKYIVRDGNRRITSIKLLNDPTKAPNSRFTEKFSKIKKQYNNFPKAIECDVYADETEIMEVLLSRHAGVNNGVGQVPWEAMAKAKYSEKIKESNPNIKALNLLRWAESFGGIEFDDTFPITTLADRIMSKENLGRIGFDLNGDIITLVGDADIAFNIVNHIINDIKNEIATSRKLIDTARHQKEYIDNLCAKYGDNSLKVTSGIGAATTTTGNTQPLQAGQPGVGKPPQIHHIPQNPKDRPKLFVRGQISFTVPANQKKAQAILAEIKNLRTDENPIAVAMLLRAFIELATDYYINKNKITINKPYKKYYNKSDSI